MIINQPRLCTNIPVWAPRYKDWSHDKKELVVLIPDYKIRSASPVLLMHFTKAKHLKGNRYCIKREKALSHHLELVKNKWGTTTPMRVIPLSDFDTWESGAEVRDLALSLFED